jgi:energy-coupling factor transporter ATP-binding protein EcfA2
VTAGGDESRGGGIDATGLKVRYPGRSTPALSGIDLVAEPGERIGVAGRTGAGKSTLALAVAGFLPRVVRATVEGSLRVDGVDPVRAPASDLLGRVGIVFATPANQLSASKQSVREELAFGLENLGVAHDEMDGRIDAVMARLGIAHLAEREPFALSGGEQQRVAIASIVAMGSRVVALDEPTAQLDPAGTRLVGEALRQLAAGGTSLLVAEHKTDLLDGVCSRIIAIDGGRIALDGPAGDVLADPRLEAIGVQPPSRVRLTRALDLAGIDRGTAAAAAEAMEAVA